MTEKTDLPPIAKKALQAGLGAALIYCAITGNPGCSDSTQVIYHTQPPYSKYIERRLQALEEKEKWSLLEYSLLGAGALALGATGYVLGKRKSSPTIETRVAS